MSCSAFQIDSALVTGTSRGLGMAVASELLSRGWRVLGVARSNAPQSLLRSERDVHAQVGLADRAALEGFLEEPLQS